MATYVDYDFKNLKWSSPLYAFSEKGKSFCETAMSRAGKALEVVMRIVERE